MEATDGCSKGYQYCMLYNALLAEVRVIAEELDGTPEGDALWKFIEREQAIVHAIETSHDGVDQVYRVKFDGWELPFLFSSPKRAKEAMEKVEQEGVVEKVTLL